AYRLERKQLVPGDDAHRWKSGRDRRRRKGDARFDLRSRTTQSVRFLYSIGVHTFARHSDGNEDRRNRDHPTDAASVAADNEVLEDEPASGTVQLVGTHGVARRRSWLVDVQASKAERTKFQMA